MKFRKPTPIPNFVRREKPRIYLGQLGNAMLTSIVIAGLVGAAATTAFRNFTNTYASSRIGRVKAKQAIVEAQVRRRALQPEAYLDCNSQSLAACRVNANYFNDLGEQNVRGARCDNKKAACGIVVRDLALNTTTRIFTATVAYAGSEANLKPTFTRLEIPLEVLQSPRFHCGDIDKTKPIFVGFRPDTGAPICEGFNACPVGKFVKGIDVSKRTLICQDLPSSVSCGDQSMLTRLGWEGAAVNFDCGGLPDPPFTAGLTTRVLASETHSVTNTETVTSTQTGTATTTTTTTNPPTATNTNTATRRLVWTYDYSSSCPSPKNDPAAVALPSAPYTTGRSLGQGVDSYQCGVHLLNSVDWETYPVRVVPDPSCPVDGATCNIYVNNNPPGLFSEGVNCFTCKPE